MSGKTFWISWSKKFYPRDLSRITMATSSFLSFIELEKWGTEEQHKNENGDEIQRETTQNIDLDKKFQQKKAKNQQAILKKCQEAKIENRTKKLFSRK